MPSWELISPSKSQKPPTTTANQNKCLLSQRLNRIQYGTQPLIHVV